jgi:hypothetical protein
VRGALVATGTCVTPAGGFAVLLALALRLELARRECFKTDAPDSGAAT